MTLYTYVPGKAELVDLMLDSAYQRLPLADTSGRPWRERLTVVVSENRALYQAHPWAAAVSTLRPPLGPGLMAKYDHELRALQGLGLTDVQMDDALAYLLSFVQASARHTTDARDAQLDSAMNDQAWWAANAPLLARRPRRGRLPAGNPSRHRRRHRRTAAPTTPTTPTTSASAASSTASPHSSIPTAELSMLADRHPV